MSMLSKTCKICWCAAILQIPLSFVDKMAPGRKVTIKFKLKKPGKNFVALFALLNIQRIKEWRPNKKKKLRFQCCDANILTNHFAKRTNYHGPFRQFWWIRQRCKPRCAGKDQEEKHCQTGKKQNRPRSIVNIQKFWPSHCYTENPHWWRDNFFSIISSKKSIPMRHIQNEKNNSVYKYKRFMNPFFLKSKAAHREKQTGLNTNIFTQYV